MSLYSSHFMTRYGQGAVFATDKGVVKVEIPDMSRPETTAYKPPPALEQSEITVYAAQQLQKYYNGEPALFDGIQVVLDSLTPFRQAVLRSIRSLQFGEISSYGQVASQCGFSHAARAVGGALAANPAPIIVPCHRVVAANGRLTGFSAPGGMITKKMLLQMEGIEFKGMLVEINQVIMHRASSS